MTSSSTELQILIRLEQQAARLLETRDELMFGPYQQLHERIRAILEVVATSEGEVPAWQRAPDRSPHTPRGN